MLRKEKFHFFFECAFSRNSVAGEKSDFGTIFCIVGCSCGIQPFGIINMKRGQAAKPVDRPIPRQDMGDRYMPLCKIKKN